MGLIYQSSTILCAMILFEVEVIYQLSEFKNVMEYTSSYQTMYDEVSSFVKESSRMHMETAKMINMIRNLGHPYAALVSAIQTEWKEGTTNLADTILRVIRCEEILKENNQDIRASDAQSPCRLNTSSFNRILHHQRVCSSEE